MITSVKRYISVLIAVICMLSCTFGSMTTVQASTESIMSAAAGSGTSGTCSWTLDNDGKLTIGIAGGTCTLASAAYTSWPWYSSRSEVENVEIAGTVKGNAKMSGLFNGMDNLVSVIGLENLNTADVTDMEYLFNGCKKLRELDLSGFNTASLQNAKQMFNGCESLEAIYAGGNWNTENILYYSDIFTGCTSLTGENGTAYDYSHRSEKDYARFDEPPAKPGYFSHKREETLPEKEGIYWAIFNEPKHEFSLIKYYTYPEGEQMSGASFHLWGISSRGTEYDLSRTTGTNGVATFDGLDSGTYMLQETEVPDDAYLDETIRTVTVKQDGTVRIDGLNESDIHNYFNVYNVTKKTKQIVVTKEWVTEHDPSELPEITIHASVEAPEPEHGYPVVYHAAGGLFNDGQETNTVCYKWNSSTGRNTLTGTVKEPTRDGNTLEGWYTSRTFADGTRIDPESLETMQLTHGMDLFAKWENAGPRYAVSVYGIGQDVDENGYSMGLTFGPATGADYTNSFKSHTPSGNTAAGNPHRCIHNDSWDEIINWNETDPNVYEQCIGEGCTKAVPLNIPNSIQTAETINIRYSGDGPSSLRDELDENARRWNTYNTSDGGTGSGKDTKNGWGGSNIRAVLNGVDNDSSDGIVTNQKVYARARNITEDTSLLAAFPENLRNAIGKKAVKYDSVYNSINDANLKTTYDKLWLLSPFEMGADYTGYGDHQREALDGTPSYYQRFEETGNVLTPRESEFFKLYYVHHLKDESPQVGISSDWLLRSVASGNNMGVNKISWGGQYSTSNTSFATPVAPCFSLSRPGMRYAVSIYGIGQDKDENGHTMGLTFGPATGTDYISSYERHDAAGSTAAGNPHRCVHDDSWDEIICWNKIDPNVYEQCIGNRCTKSVPLNIPKSIKTTEPVGPINYTGDGPAVLKFELQDKVNVWNAWGTSYGGTGSNGSGNTGGWGASNIRALLNGVDNDASDGITTTARTFAQTKGLTEKTSLIGAFPENLQKAIGKKAVRYDSVGGTYTDSNLKTTYDKLWLLSTYEMGYCENSSVYGDHSREALNNSPGYYQRFTEAGETLTPASQSLFTAYHLQTLGASWGTAAYWWLRSIPVSSSALRISNTGNMGTASTNNSLMGVSPCFCLSR